MFEEYKLYRYIVPGWLFIFYTFLFILPFLSSEGIKSLAKVEVIIAIGALGLPIGFVLYQAWLPIEMDYEYDKKKDFLGNDVLREKEYKYVYEKYKLKKKMGKRNEFFWERELIRHLISSPENELSSKNWRNLWNYHDSRKYNGIYIPISAFTIFCVIVIIVALNFFGCLNVNWLQSLFISHNEICERVIFFLIILVLISVVSYEILQGAERVWKQIHYLEPCLLKEVLSGWNRF